MEQDNITAQEIKDPAQPNGRTDTPDIPTPTPKNASNKLVLFGIFSIIILAVLGIVWWLNPFSNNNSVQVSEKFEPMPTQIPLEGTVNWLSRWKGEGKREDLINEIAKEFSAQNPEVQVNLDFSLDEGLKTDPEIAAEIVKMIETDDYTWDVIIANTGVYGDVAEALGDPNWASKYLVDFNDVDGFPQTQKDFILDGYTDEYGGVLVGPFIEGFFISLWYNKEVADQVGIDIKQYGMTFDDFLSYAKAVYDYNIANGTDIGTIYESNSDWRTTENMFAHLFKSEIGDLTLVKSGVLTDQKKAALLKTFQKFEELSQYKPLLAGHDNRVWADTKAMSFDGTTLFTVNGSWMYSHWTGIDEEKTDNMIPAELPVFQETDFYMGSFITQFGVMKNSPNKDIAIELLKFISRPQIAEKWVRYTKAPTGIKGNLTTSDTVTDQFEKFQADINDKYQGQYHFSDNAGYMLGEENQLLDSVVDELMIDVLDGELTSQQAYNSLIIQLK